MGHKPPNQAASSCIPLGPVRGVEHAPLYLSIRLITRCPSYPDVLHFSILYSIYNIIILSKWLMMFTYFTKQFNFIIRFNIF